MRLLIILARQYPGRTAVTLFALLLSGSVEGIGLSALFPMLNLMQQPGENPQVPEWLAANLAYFGLQPTIGVLLSLLVIGMWLKALLIMLANSQVGYTVARVATDLRLRLLQALMRARWSYYHRQSTGALANSVATEAMRASEAYLQGARMISMLVQAIVAAVVAVNVSWQVTLTALGGGILVLGTLNWLVRITRRAGKRQTDLQRSLLATLTDLLHSVKPLKAMAREYLGDRVLQSETQNLNRALQKQVLSKEALRAAQEPMLTTLGAAGLLVYITQIEEQMPLASLMMLILLLVRVLIQLNKVQRQYQEMVASESAFFAIQDAIHQAEAAEEVRLGDQQPELVEAIRLDDVSLNYDDKRVLKNASLKIPAGAMTTLIGPSGSGKTTIVDLVAGLVRPQSGEVWIGHTAMADVDIKNWRRQIGYVPQETLLLHDTLLHNVTLGDPDISQQQVEQALREADAWDFVASLPEGLHTLVGERGGLLSGGQRQRIIIARALVQRPALLILDEATSALDPDSEAGIARTLGHLRGELTILAVSHRPALIEAADYVYRLDRGRVEALNVDSSGQMSAQQAPDKQSGAE
ncbi:MAG: ABC transporter ATP-binding protein [Wenzhouxiangellaceae bacterium]